MYNSRFGWCGFPCFGSGNRMSRSWEPKRTGAPSCTSKEERGHGCRDGKHGNCKKLLLKSSEFGGFALPRSTVREAAYHVASLNLDTSGWGDFLVLLNFSCNITSSAEKLHLRFQIFRQDQCQAVPVPVSSGILYEREEEHSESNAFTLSVCDRDCMAAAWCNYSVYAGAEDAGVRCRGLIANPVLTASIMEKG